MTYTAFEADSTEKKIKCEIRRAKKKRHLGTRIGGDAWEKCGRKSIGRTQFGVPICKKCAEEYFREIIPWE